MERIFLIRHGRPVYEDDSRRFIGVTDIALSAEGRSELESLKIFFQRESAGRVYASPLLRARETAEAVFGPDMPVTVVDGVAEIDMGLWENMTFEAVKQRFPEEFKRRGESFADFTPPGGESFRDCQRRSVSALREIAERGGGSAAVVAHAGVNRSILCALTGHPLDRLFDFRQDFGCVNELTVAYGVIKYVRTFVP